MRLFIGIGLPIAVSEILANAAQGLLPSGGGRVIRWTSPGNMHVTLQFLGRVEPARLDEIEHALVSIRATRLQVKLKGLNVLGDRSILTATVEASATLLALAQQTLLAMERCGFPPEQR